MTEAKLLKRPVIMVISINLLKSNKTQWKLVKSFVYVRIISNFSLLSQPSKFLIMQIGVTVLYREAIACFIEIINANVSFKPFKANNLYEVLFNKSQQWNVLKKNIELVYYFLQLFCFNTFGKTTQIFEVKNCSCYYTGANVNRSLR